MAFHCSKTWSISPARHVIGAEPRQPSRGQKSRHAATGPSYFMILSSDRTMHMSKSKYQIRSPSGNKPGLNRQILVLRPDDAHVQVEVPNSIAVRKQAGFEQADFVPPSA